MGTEARCRGWSLHERRYLLWSQSPGGRAQVAPGQTWPVLHSVLQLALQESLPAPGLLLTGSMSTAGTRHRSDQRRKQLASRRRPVVAANNTLDLLIFGGKNFVGTLCQGYHWEALREGHQIKRNGVHWIKVQEGSVERS